jgi:hypothetical protein
MNTELEWMRFEELHGKVHVIIRQFEQIFNKEHNHALRETKVFDLIQGYARTHLNDLIAAGQKHLNLQSYIQDERLKPFWKGLLQGHRAADGDNTVENVTPN